MTVKVSKPAINVREELADLRKPTGIAGEAMLRAETPQEQFNLIGAGRRNLLINGDFSVSQRGSYNSVTAVANNAYYIDRWSVALSSVTGSIQHNEVVLPNGTKTMAMKVAGTSTNTSIGYVGARQVIEDFRVLSGQVVTASMWVRTNLSSLTFRHDSTTNFGDYVTPDGEWHYHTATYQMPTITSTGRNANQTTLAIINYTGSAGGGVTSGEYFEVAQVQLELGKVATPFEHRSYGEELAACQRYFQRFSYGQYNYFGIAVAPTGVATALTDPKAFIVPMRAGPTGSVARTGGSPVLVNIGAGNYNITSLAVNTFGGNSHWWVQGTSSLPTRESDFYESGGSGTTTFDLDAEL
jgi:hypothetical protein